LYDAEQENTSSVFPSQMLALWQSLTRHPTAPEQTAEQMRPHFWVGVWRANAGLAVTALAHGTRAAIRGRAGFRERALHFLYKKS
jgi:hypothetical protein